MYSIRTEWPQKVIIPRNKQLKHQNKMTPYGGVVTGSHITRDPL